MNLSGLEPGQREDNADHHDGHVETDGLPVGVGDLADNIENGANKADPHDHGEHTLGHMEDGFFPLLGEHVGDLSHIEDEDGRRGVGAQEGHVGDGGDVNTQEEGRHGDDIVDHQVLVRGLELGMQVTELFGQPAVVREHDERDGDRANQAVEGGSSRAQGAAGHEEDVFGPCQEVVGDDAQRLVGNLVKRENAGAHDTHEGKEDGNGRFWGTQVPYRRTD